MAAEVKVVLPGLGKKQIIFGSLFLVVAALFLLTLWRGLESDPTKVPSAFLGQPALGFEVKWLQGQQHLAAPRAEGFGMADFKGRPIILNFWASWCYSCRAEASDF
ncbi:MAG: hypothetical protein AAB834_05265, partial [Patescibacteria group bacterium]